MKRLSRLFVLFLLCVGLCSNVGYAKEFWGTNYNSKDEYKASRVLKDIKKGKKVRLVSNTTKRSERIAAAFCGEYFPLLDFDDVITQYGVTIKGKEYDEYNFPSKKKYKKLCRAERKQEKKLKKMVNAWKSWEKRIAKNCRIGYNSQKEQFIALEKYMISSMKYKDNDDLRSEYDYFGNDDTYGNSYIVYKTNGGICADFAQTVDEICEKMGIECYVVLGGTEKDLLNHAWNLVILDGDAYQVDVTWDICRGEVYYGLNCSEEEFRSQHKLIKIY